MLRVSRILAEAIPIDTSRFTEESRIRGREVHAIAEAIFQRQEVSVAPAFEGYASALAAGIAALRFEPVCIERRLSTDFLTGRPDAIGFIAHHLGSGIHAGPTIVDVKSGEPSPTHGLQLALYEYLANVSGLHALLPPAFGDTPWNRVALYVAENGRYRIHPYTDPGDYVIAHAALDLARWRVAHGLLDASGDAAQPDDPAFPDLMEVN